MRAGTKIVAGLSVVAFGLTAGAAQAENPPLTEPDASVAAGTSGGLLPICINTIQVTVFGTPLLNVPKLCIG